MDSGCGVGSTEFSEQYSLLYYVLFFVILVMHQCKTWEAFALLGCYLMWLVVGHQRLGTDCWPHCQVSGIPVLGLVMPCNIQDGQRPQLYCSGSLKSLMVISVFKKQSRSV